MKAFSKDPCFQEAVAQRCPLFTVAPWCQQLWTSNRWQEGTGLRNVPGDWTNVAVFSTNYWCQTDYTRCVPQDKGMGYTDVWHQAGVPVPGIVEWKPSWCFHWVLLHELKDGFCFFLPGQLGPKLPGLFCTLLEFLPKAQQTANDCSNTWVGRQRPWMKIFPGQPIRLGLCRCASSIKVAEQ